MSADFADGDPGSLFVAANLCSPANGRATAQISLRHAPSFIFPIALGNPLVEEIQIAREKENCFSKCG